MATHVFVLEYFQPEGCCTGHVDTGALDVFATAQLARAAARVYLRDNTHDNVYGEWHFSEDIADYDEFAAMLVKALREACTVQGLSAKGAADELRSRLREAKFARLRAKVRTDLLAACAPAESLERAVERALDDNDDEFQLCIEKAEMAFFAGEDNADDFEGAACEEKWNADGSGTITAPYGASCCQGPLTVTMTVTRFKIRDRLPAKKKA